MRGVAVTLAGFAVIALLLAWSRWLARQRVASLGHVALAATAAMLAALLWAATDSLAHFKPLSRELPVAEIHFEQTDPGRYRATFLHLPAGRPQVFEMPGERWRIAAKTLDWLGPAAALGLRPAFQLRSLQSAGSTSDTEPGAVLRDYTLAERTGFDVWSRARSGGIWSRVAVGGEAVGPWLPMSQGAQYRVRVTDGTMRVERSASGAMSLAPGGP